MNTCQTCKFWEDGICDRMEVRGPRHPNLPVEKGKAFVEWNTLDDSGLEIQFITDKDFGCLLHEA